VACATLSEKEAAEFEQRFFREAKSAGRLNHPNIVTVYDVGRDGDLAWIAMEFLAGRSLRDLLDAGEPLAPGRIVGIGAAVADALAFAHAQGVIHRDVKPANIMVLDSGVVKLADFGIAQLPGSGLTMTGAVLGSPKYMAPEQISGHKADGRSDIFSLGVVLYELLAGKPPFEGENLHAAMYQVVHKEPPPPSACRDGQTNAFDAVITKALAKDPAARYQDAAALATALRRALREAAAPPAGTSARPTPDISGTLSAAAPASRRLRNAAIIGAFALLAGAAILYWRPATKPAATPTPAASESVPPPAKSAGTTAVPSASAPAMQATAEPGPAAGRATAASDAVAPHSAERAPQRPLPRPVVPPTERKTAAARPAGPSDWREMLRADINACESLPVFRRVLCIEKARWRHCPGHWGEIADCPSSVEPR
jgi:serine/threonine-protein kinase